jgi:hypothetical protein
MKEPPDVAEHERCRDWARYPFPFREQLGRLRVIARRLARVQREIFRVGRRLAECQRRWPADALAVLAAGRRDLAALRVQLQMQLDDHWPPRLG